MTIPISILDDIRSKTVLSKLIGKTLPLQLAGREWKACCPFHEEKTPSFMVNDQKGFYHCFGCGAHGDAIKWLIDSRGMSLKDAVSLLALEAGIEIAESDKRTSKESRLSAVVNMAAKKGGGKLSRSETVTVRLDPKLNYLCELAARAQRRTKSSFIEWAVADSLGSVSLPEVFLYDASLGNNRDATIQEKASQLWHVDEADRMVALALIAPALLTHEEQLVWRLVKENGFLWRGYFNLQNEWVWDVGDESLIRDRLRDNWELFKAVAAGDADSTSLPKWLKRREEDFDADPSF